MYLILNLVTPDLQSLIRSSKFTFQSDPKTYRQFVGRAKDLFSTKVLNPTYLLQPSPSAETSPPTNRQETDINSWIQRFQAELRGVHELSNYLTRNIVQAQHSPDGKRLGGSWW